MSSSSSSSPLNKDLFPIVLCVSKISNKPTSAGNSKVSIQKGLSIEAFKLSDQAIRLVDKGFITMQKDDTPSSSSSSNSRSSSSSSNGNANQNGKVRLTSEVLFKNDETTEVDPLLIAVPLSIIHKQPTQPSDASVVKSFQHSFPTQSEINSKADMSILAKKYSSQILQKLTKNDVESVRMKLRDVHLLLYLSDMFDTDTVRNIASCASGSGTKLNQRSVMALQMLTAKCDDDNDEL